MLDGLDHEFRLLNVQIGKLTKKFVLTDSWEGGGVCCCFWGVFCFCFFFLVFFFLLLNIYSIHVLPPVRKMCPISNLPHIGENITIYSNKSLKVLVHVHVFGKNTHFLILFNQMFGKNFGTINHCKKKCWTGVMFLSF